MLNPNTNIYQETNTHTHTAKNKESRHGKGKTDLNKKVILHFTVGDTECLWLNEKKEIWFESTV